MLRRFEPISMRALLRQRSEQTLDRAVPVGLCDANAVWCRAIQRWMSASIDAIPMSSFISERRYEFALRHTEMRLRGRASGLQGANKEDRFPVGDTVRQGARH